MKEFEVLVVNNCKPKASIHVAEEHKTVKCTCDGHVVTYAWSRTRARARARSRRFNFRADGLHAIELNNFSGHDYV